MLKEYIKIEHTLHVMPDRVLFTSSPKGEEGMQLKLCPVYDTPSKTDSSGMPL